MNDRVDHSSVAAIHQLTERPESERFIGAYQLIRQLGKGGFAPVWLAREMLGHVELRQVAIKLLAADSRPSSLGDENPRAERQRRYDTIVEEVRALCRVQHPSVVHFYGTVAHNEFGLVGLVMELLNGETLRARLDFVETLSQTEALDLAIQMAWALAAVHRAGLVHRDLTPANIMVVENSFRLIDFGIAQPPLESAAPLSPVRFPDYPAEVARTKASPQFRRWRTAEGHLVRAAYDSGALMEGTIGYIDPASLSAPPSFRSDLYSLGATLFECLTGRLPAAAAADKQGASGLRGAVLDGREPAPAVHELRPDVCHILRTLIDALLSPDPRQRPPSAEAVAWQLEGARLETTGSRWVLPREGPFRGLRRFEAADRAVLFGRTTELAISLEMLRGNGILTLVGPSGCGKSSLARAGVAPAVEDGRLGGWPRKWTAIIIEPGEEPKKRIRQTLAPLIPEAQELGPDALITALSDHVRQHERGILLLVDQLEELATLKASSEERNWTARFLGRLSAPVVPGLRGLLVARRDLLDPLLALSELGRALPRSMLLVAPMSRDTWGVVLDQTLTAYGYKMGSDDLRAAILAQIGDTPMPLVQFALTRLWAGRCEDEKTIPQAALDSIGGIAGALNAHAEAARDALRREDPFLAITLKRVLLELTTAEGTRRSVSIPELETVDQTSRVHRVIAVLAKARLIEREGRLLRLPHEALIEQWRALRGWVEEAREDRRLVLVLERDAEAWANQRDYTLLWRGPRLARACSLVREGDFGISVLAQHFLNQGTHAERVARARWVVMAVALLASGLAVGGTYVRAINRALTDEQNAREAATLARVQAEYREANETAARRLEEQAKERATRAENAEKALRESYRLALTALVERVDRAESAAELRSLQQELREQLRYLPRDPPTPTSARKSNLPLLRLKP